MLWLKKLDLKSKKVTWKNSFPQCSRQNSGATCRRKKKVCFRACVSYIKSVTNWRLFCSCFVSITGAQTAPLCRDPWDAHVTIPWHFDFQMTGKFLLCFPLDIIALAVKMNRRNYSSSKGFGSVSGTQSPPAGAETLEQHTWIHGTFTVQPELGGRNHSL